ncbi:SAM-dependent methyltransferase [Nonomuraea sp. CA-143628]|uniref:SAM-dependent methyltransferase n=1 Tax=Nonomuraea sp. CA-143628 TaxID=3239997 RepID=UPI003D903B59
MLTQWAARYGSYGVGSNISKVFLAAARDRADELDVADHVRFIEADAGTYEDEPHPYDIVSCMGATWIGGGLAGTLTLIRRLLRPGGLAPVGDCYWITPIARSLCIAPSAERFLRFAVRYGQAHRRRRL